MYVEALLINTHDSLIFLFNQESCKVLKTTS